MADSQQPISIVVVAGGSGERFGGPKQFADLAGWPLLAYCLRAFDSVPNVARRVVVLPRGGTDHPTWQRVSIGLSNPIEVVDGGATRALSVRAGVERAAESSAIVAVHDGARPFPPMDAMKSAAELLANGGEDLGAVIVARRATDTLKRIATDGRIEATVDRSVIACAETPQVVRAAALLAALSAPGADLATDEAHAIERAGGRTAVVLHEGHNPKITHPADLALATVWLATDHGAVYRLAHPTA